MRRRIVIGIISLLSAVLLVGAAVASLRGGSTQRTRAGGETDRGASAEAQEQAESTQERLEALGAAGAATLGRTEAIHRAPAAGWAGEKLMGGTADDWEPAIAADPNAPYVYILHNRYGGPKACANSCPDPAMILNVSSNGGTSFGTDAFLCTCRNTHGQFDPLIEVVRNTGAVYASWMNDSDIMFSKSLNHGATWTTPAPVFGNVSWGDKPQITTSADGVDVYISFNGPTDGDPWIATSHDSGTTWTQTKVTNSKRYYFEYGSAVVPDGNTIVFSEISFTYSGPGAAAEGPVLIHVFRSINKGASWTDTVVDTVQLGVGCTSAGCYPDFYDSGPALAMGTGGHLDMVYSGAITAGGPRTVFARSSTDGGATWSSRVTLSTSGVNSAFPAAAGSGTDGVRVWFQAQLNGRWNTWYTSSTNLGSTWSTPVKISDATSGTAYKNSDGYLEVYGDYGEIAVTNAGKTVAVWGEGTSYLGPGGVWFNRQN